MNDMSSFKLKDFNFICQDVSEIVVDEANKIVTTPAFMYGTGKFHEIHDGVSKMVNSVIKML